MAAYWKPASRRLNGDAAFICKGSGDSARAQGMTQVGQRFGASFQGEFSTKALSGERSPSFWTTSPESRTLLD